MKRMKMWMIYARVNTTTSKENETQITYSFFDEDVMSRYLKEASRIANAQQIKFEYRIEQVDDDPEDEYATQHSYIEEYLLGRKNE